MYYCFIDQDLQISQKSDPLYLQMEYAKVIDRFLLLNLQDGFISESRNVIKTDADEKVLLRGSYDNTSLAMRVLHEKNINLVEKENEVQRIEQWPFLGCIKRRIVQDSLFNIINGNLPEIIATNIGLDTSIFIKSITKGFSLVTTKKKIIEKNDQLINYLNHIRFMYGDKVWISVCHEVKRDSLGKRETRHFVLDGNIVNSSRNLHSVRHIVTKSHLRYASTIVEYISTVEFPSNYVLDIGEFSDGLMDIIEINPISSAMCYVNNSVFLDYTSEIEEIHKETCYGYEYCLDYLKNPDKYILERKSNRSYEYTSETQIVI